MERQHSDSALPVAQPPAQQTTPPNSLCTKPKDTMNTAASWTSWDDLGKPTLRGIRKCPHCGIYNGTRSLSCKNKACGAIFRGPVSTAGTRRAAKKPLTACPEVVRLVTSEGGSAFVDVGADLTSPSSSFSPSSSSPSPAASGRQVFSLRHRCRGPEQRGFVQLTLTDTTIATMDGTLLTRLSLGHCFLPACRRQQKQKQQKDSQPAAIAVSLSSSPSSLPQVPDRPCCDHVRQAMECPAEQVATPLLLKSSVLDALPLTPHVRQELWKLATEAGEGGGPLVQRVSRSSLVVRCDRSEAQPLGLLHCTLCRGGSGGGAKAVAKGDRVGGMLQKGDGGGGSGTAVAWPIFRCTCHQGAGASTRGGGGGGGGGGAASADVEQAHHWSLDNSLGGPVSPEALSLSVGAASRCVHFYACAWAFASDKKLSVEFAHFFNNTSSGLQMRLGPSAPAGACEVKTSPDTALSRFLTPPCSEASKAKRLKVEEQLAVAGPTLAIREVVTLASGSRKPSTRRHPLSSGHTTSPGSIQPMDETHATLPFQQWLASVNEKIHQAMHYQFDGKPEPLVFHIPQSFFNVLQQRLSLGSKKRRLPNFTTTFVRQDAPPLGSFSKYTWHITNLIHVKQIFDTPEFPLKFTQSFVRNSDGSYSPFSCPDVAMEPLAEALGRTHAIRPHELHTFLKVGISSPEQKEPTPFVIEWIPDILPRCRVGELRLRFEYGHQPSSQPDP